MPSMLLVAAFFLSLAATMILVPVVRWAAVRLNWVDIPDVQRKVHEHPTPNVGGIAIAMGFGIGLSALALIAGLYDSSAGYPGLLVLIGAVIMLLTGFYDDVKSIGFRRKFFAQVIVAYLLIIAGYEIDIARMFLPEGTVYSHALITVPVTIVWVVGVINAINLLDGLDGLISGIGIIAFAALAVIFGLNAQDPGLLVIAALMIGTLVGFLVYNFQPASIFMGDSGSLFLGYMLAVFTLQGSSSDNSILALLIPLTVLGLPILDTSLCMFRRIMEGRSPFSPDDDHIHHRMSRLLSHRRAVLALYSVALWFAIAAVLMAISTVLGGVLIGLITVSAAYVGIRTLGYLDINISKLLNRKDHSIRIDTQTVESAPAVDAKSLRQHHVHYDVVSNNRTLPVGFAETRGPWRRDNLVFDEGSGDGPTFEAWVDAQSPDGSMLFGESRAEHEEVASAATKKNDSSNGSSNGHSDKSRS